MLKLAIIGAAGYAAYRYLEKTGRLPTRDDVNAYVGAAKEKTGFAAAKPTRTQA